MRAKLLSDSANRLRAERYMVAAVRLTLRKARRRSVDLRVLEAFVAMTCDAIAELLDLGRKTIHNHHYAIKRKIGAQTDAHLVGLAVGAALVGIADVRFDVDSV